MARRHHRHQGKALASERREYRTRRSADLDRSVAAGVRGGCSPWGSGLCPSVPAAGPHAGQQAGIRPPYSIAYALKSTVGTAQRDRYRYIFLVGLKKVWKLPLCSQQIQRYQGTVFYVGFYNRSSYVTKQMIIWTSIFFSVTYNGLEQNQWQFLQQNLPNFFNKRNWMDHANSGSGYERNDLLQIGILLNFSDTDFHRHLQIFYGVLYPRFLM